jgi:hypothetical protein
MLCQHFVILSVCNSLEHPRPLKSVARSQRMLKGFFPLIPSPANSSYQRLSSAWDLSGRSGVLAEVTAGTEADDSAGVIAYLAEGVSAAR